MKSRGASNYFKDKIILINKQAGITSHDEVINLRRILGMRRIGHSGTLDPKVTGMLVMATGKATKVLEYMLLSEKIYIAEFIFHKPVSEPGFDKALKEFTGKINQLPPKKSAVKRIERERTVYDLELLEWDKSGRRAVVRCAVERGTYIRKLVHDMGESMGVKSHMGDLHRIAVGPFNETNHKTVTTRRLKLLIKISLGIPLLQKLLLSKYVYTIGEALGHLGSVIIDPGAEGPVMSGSPLYAVGVKELAGSFVIGDIVVMKSETGKAIAVGEAVVESSRIQDMNSGLAIKTKKVFI